MSEKVGQVRNRLKKELEDIWLAEPPELGQLRRAGGAFYRPGPVILYAESETREILDYLWYFRLAAKQGVAPLAVLQRVASFVVGQKADKLEAWYKLKHTAAIVRDGLSEMEAADDQEDYVAVIDALLVYLSRFNYWLDSVIPWAAVSGVFDEHLRQ